MANEIVLQWNPSPTPVQGYNVYRGTLPGNESAVPLNPTLVTVLSPQSMSSVAASVGGSAVYTGTFPGGAANAYAGLSFTITGYANASNNGTFPVTASTTTTVTVLNPSAVAESHASLANQMPQYADTGVFPGQVYSYEITAVSNGVESTDSIGILSTPAPFGPTPLAPFFIGLDNFIVLAATAITNTGATDATGDVGVYPGTSITGFGPPAAINGVFHAADFVAATGQGAAQMLYNALALMTPTAPIVADLGGTTLPPGVYNSASSIGLTGALTLDGQGNPNAAWIFQAGSSLTVAGDVLLVNGANADNVFWQVGSSASIAADNVFRGTIVAQASISVAAGATVEGRLLALSGAITLSDNSIYLTNSVPFAGLWAPNTAYSLGEAIFDPNTGTFQQVAQAGTSGASRPTFSATPGAQVVDNNIIWSAVSIAGVILLLPLLPSPPNVAPSAPAAPTGLRIAFED